MVPGAEKCQLPPHQLPPAGVGLPAGLLPTPLQRLLCSRAWAALCAAAAWILMGHALPAARRLLQVEACLRPMRDLLFIKPDAVAVGISPGAVAPEHGASGGKKRADLKGGEPSPVDPAVKLAAEALMLSSLRQHGATSALMNILYGCFLLEVMENTTRGYVFLDKARRLRLSMRVRSALGCCHSGGRATARMDNGCEKPGETHLRRWRLTAPNRCVCGMCPRGFYDAAFAPHVQERFMIFVRDRQRTQRAQVRAFQWGMSVNQSFIRRRSMRARLLTSLSLAPSRAQSDSVGSGAMDLVSCACLAPFPARSPAGCRSKPTSSCAACILIAHPAPPPASAQMSSSRPVSAA